MSNLNLVIITILLALAIREGQGQWKGPKPDIREKECQWGSVGVCDRFAHCPEGSFCKGNSSTGTALCCRIHQMYGQSYGTGQCLWGAIGMCRRSNTYCPTGSTCQFLWQMSNTGLCCRESPGVCPSDTTGSRCSKQNPCKTGYICRIGVCCREPVCPRGWIEGGMCNLLRSEKCSEGFECINNQFCCRSTFCPSGSVGPECSKRNHCNAGYSCRGGNCCREPVCPPNWLEDGVCNFTPGHSVCAEGFDCNNGFCCKRPDPVSCPYSDSGPRCWNNEECKYGYECRAGICCRMYETDKK